MATIFEGQFGIEVRRCSFCFSGGTVIIIFGAPDPAATLIFSASSAAIWSSRPEAASGGFVTKSKAPSAKAFNVTEAPRSVCALTRITGTRCFRVICRSISNPSIRGMSRSPAPRPDHHHENSFRPFRRLQIFQALQPHQRQHLLPQLEHFMIVHA